MARFYEAGILADEILKFEVPGLRWGSSGNVALFGNAATSNLSNNHQPHAVLGFGAVSPNDSVTWVQSVHARWLETSRSKQFRGRLKRKLNPFHRVAIAREKALFGGRRYRRLLALTPEVADDLVQYYGVPLEDIDIVPNGVDPVEFCPVDEGRKAELRARFGAANDKKLISFIANESDRKGLPQLIEAVSRLKDPAVHVLAAGRVGPAVARLAEEFGVQDQVTWVGLVEEVAPVFQVSDLFVLPTAYEAWGLVIVEALACGVPVITTRLAGAACVVKENENGCLLDAADDVDTLTAYIRTSLDRKDWNSQEIAASVEAYAWKNIIARVAGILEQAYADRPWGQPAPVNRGAIRS